MMIILYQNLVIQKSMNKPVISGSRQFKVVVPNTGGPSGRIQPSDTKVLRIQDILENC